MVVHQKKVLLLYRSAGNATKKSVRKKEDQRPNILNIDEDILEDSIKMALQKKAPKRVGQKKMKIKDED